MALIIPQDYAHCLLPMRHTALSRSAAITFGIRITSVGGDYQTVADDMVVAFVNAWDSELDSEVTVGPAILRVGQDGGDPITVEGTTTDTGSETGAMQPPNSNLLVKKTTAAGGRRGRGRCFIPWVLQDAAVSDVGQIDSGSLAVRQADADTWLDNMNAGGTGTYDTPMVLLHDSRGSGAEPAPFTVTGLTCPSLIAVQNRRIGRG